MNTIDHITMTVADIGKSRTFYEKALEPLGICIEFEHAPYVGFGRNGKPEFWLGPAGDGDEAQHPMHLCFTARNRNEVNAFYHAALAAGGKDNGKPGLREQYHPNYYGAFVIDPDGHNIEAVCHVMEQAD